MTADRERPMCELLARLLDGTARLERGPFGILMLIDTAAPRDEIRIVGEREVITLKVGGDEPGHITVRPRWDV